MRAHSFRWIQAAPWAVEDVSSVLCLFVPPLPLAVPTSHSLLCSYLSVKAKVLFNIFLGERHHVRSHFLLMLVWLHSAIPSFEKSFWDGHYSPVRFTSLAQSVTLGRSEAGQENTLGFPVAAPLPGSLRLFVSFKCEKH